MCGSCFLTLHANCRKCQFDGPDYDTKRIHLDTHDPCFTPYKININTLMDEFYEVSYIIRKVRF